MRTAEIITIVDYGNYGNRLQNYAMNKILQDMGYATGTLKIIVKENRWKSTNKRMLRLIKRFLPFTIYKLIHKYYQIISIDTNYKIAKQRFNKFVNFTNEYISNTQVLYVKENKDVNRILKNKDVSLYVAGSDQIWNPDFAGDDFYFLTFAPCEKRIAIAASFGCNDLPENVCNRYIPLLKEMKFISMREKCGADLVRKMTGKTCEMIVDPTMLISKKEWNKIIKMPEIQVPPKYIVTYFLGESPKIDYEIIWNDCEIINLNDVKYLDYFVLDPAEFLYVLKNACLVLTDSFHGTVFSILFERQFYVFRRNDARYGDLYSRISSLLEIFGLQNREISVDDLNEELTGISDEKWEQVRKILEEKRNADIEKLSRVLDSNFG